MKIDISLMEWKRILSKLNIIIAREGNDKIFCLCPFHNDTNASLVIYLETNKFKCYSIYCGKKGDVFDLISIIIFKADKGKFQEAINWLRSIIPDSRLKSYIKQKEKAGGFTEVFCEWVKSNELLQDYSFLGFKCPNIKEVRLVKSSSWNCITSFIKIFDFTEKIEKEDLFLVNFEGLGYFVYNGKGNLISRALNKFFNYNIFEKFNGSFLISGKDFKPNKELNKEKIISTVFYTENPLYYFELESVTKIALGVVSTESIFNFQDKFFIFCFIILDDLTTNIEDRFNTVFKFHLDEKTPWFYKRLKIKKDEEIKGQVLDKLKILI
jgi:hypothetical protein